MRVRREEEGVLLKAEDRLPEGGLVEGPWQTVGGGRSGPAGRVEAVMAKRCEEGAEGEKDRERKRER